MFKFPLSCTAYCIASHFINWEMSILPLAICWSFIQLLTLAFFLFVLSRDSWLASLREKKKRKKKYGIVRNRLRATTKSEEEEEEMESLQKQIKYRTACQQSIIKFRFTTKARSQNFSRESRTSNKIKREREQKMRIENLSDTGSLALARALCVFSYASHFFTLYASIRMRLISICQKLNSKID